MLSDFATLLRHNTTKSLPTPGLDYDEYFAVKDVRVGNCSLIDSTNPEFSWTDWEDPLKIVKIIGFSALIPTKYPPNTG
jgi:hypothetical protein